LTIGSSVLLSQLHRSCIGFIECATSAPDGSSPQGYSRIFLFGYRLKNIYTLLLAVLAAQLGTPRGRYYEHNGKFPSIMKPRFNRLVGERNHF
jgi:hypothetical protein